MSGRRWASTSTSPARHRVFASANHGGLEDEISRYSDITIDRVSVPAVLVKKIEAEEVVQEDLQARHVALSHRNRAILPS